MMVIALVKFYYWLEENYKKNKITEFEASEKLEKFRKENTNYFSFKFSYYIGYRCQWVNNTL